MITEDDMGWYERNIFNPLIVDRSIGAPRILDERRRALGAASGEILEIGPGTGLNLTCYPAAVRSLTALGPEATLDPRAARRAAERGVRVDHVSGDARRLPFDAGRFDTVVCTFVLCTIPEPARAVREIARVLAPGGRLLFLEHVAAAAGARRVMQRLLNAPLKPVLCGCEMTRDTERTLAEGGFTFASIEHYRMQASPAMWLHCEVIRGVATSSS
jgi:ubiquinone/menaquinone biosynthesis C-methylase UbiE